MPTHPPVGTGSVDIFDTIDAHLSAHRAASWSGTFREYLPIVIANPSLAQRAHSRLYAMIRDGGLTVDDDGTEHYAFFEHDLFGIDGPLTRVVEYFKAAAMGSDVGRRILLLYGPPSSGKSQLAILLKRGLEAYTQTDETEFTEFLADKKSEALHDRMIMVRIPYNLQMSQEERIYQKLLSVTTVQDVHMAPHALKVAAMFAVMSRLEEPKIAGLTLVKKMKLYNGEETEGFRQKNVKQIKEQTEREGMDGLSPRFIINRISTSLIRPNTKCLNPIDMLRALKDGVEQLSQLKKPEREKYLNLIADTRREFDEIARTDVQKAFFVSFASEALTLLDNYLDNVEAYLDKTKIPDEITGEDKEPNEKLMRSIEEKIQVPDHGKDSFRNEILRKVALAHRHGEMFDYTTHEKLKEAIEKQLFEERRDTIKLTISARSPDPEQLRKLNEVVETLVSREGYCAECANELLKYISSLLAREK